MLMSSKKRKIRLFENDVTITGIHASHMKFLVNETKLFNDYIDVYMNAAVFGYYYSKKENKDTEIDDRARIYADAFSTHREECLFIYRLIMLLDDSEVPLEERLDRTFRYDSNDEKDEELAECIELFHKYVRGGIEYMFEKFTSGCTSEEDYLKASFDITRDFKDSIDGVSYSEKIQKILGR